MLKAMQISKKTWVMTFAASVLLLVACGPPAYNQRAPATPPVPRAPTPVSMDGTLVLGLWNSNFGAVKIERDTKNGDDRLMGVWVYDRGGREIVGYFTGDLKGNVLEFSWHEPSEPAPLMGRGYLSFRTDGKGFSGRWWSNDQRRGGLFSGSRDRVMQPMASAHSTSATPEPAPAAPAPTRVDARESLPAMSLEDSP